MVMSFCYVKSYLELKEMHLHHLYFLCQSNLSCVLIGLVLKNQETWFFLMKPVKLDEKHVIFFLFFPDQVFL